MTNNRRGLILTTLFSGSQTMASVMALQQGMPFQQNYTVRKFVTILFAVGWVDLNTDLVEHLDFQSRRNVSRELVATVSHWRPQLIMTLKV